MNFLQVAYAHQFTRRDRRSLGGTSKPSGVLIGHTEGITYVSAKGDGRYVISNGKDQILRLWDLRMMRSNSDFETATARGQRYGIPGYDYRCVSPLILSSAFSLTLSVEATHTLDHVTRRIHSIAVL